MIDLYYWPTPNGWKISIALEELGLPYTVRPVNIGRGDQFEPAFLAISPNNRIPALVDHDPPGGGAPFASFETGAMLLYLAEKTGRLLPADWRGRHSVLPWLMWQMGGLGPMLGQHGHFRLYAPEKTPTPSTAMNARHAGSTACSTPGWARPAPMWLGTPTASPTSPSFRGS